MKFFNLLKKELRESINKQMILSIFVIFVIFSLMGTVMNSSIEEMTTQSVSINLCDKDDTELTQSIIKDLKDSDIEVKLIESQSDDYSAILSDNNIKNLIIIPEGFSDILLNDDTKTNIISVSAMESASMTSMTGGGNATGIAMIRSILKDILAEKAGVTEETLNIIDSPVVVIPETVVNDKSSQISPDDIVAKVMIQNMILPLVVFILIIMTSQMLVTAVSNEKIDKTLETLLSTPVSRGSVIGAKMLAAAIVALINAVAYMISFTTAFMGEAVTTVSEIPTESMGEIISSTLTVEARMTQLGLTLSMTDYLLVGVQLFLTIMICLSISIILGALVSDVKSSQSVIMPLMMMAMIPFMISMFTDINSLPTVIKYLVYAIPFTHTFTAIPNLMFGNDMLFFIGLIYQIFFFCICMFFALKIFKSDKIFTISLNFGQKSKFKKNSTANNE